MKGLKKLFERFENLMSAVTFAEAGEFETARKFVREEKAPRKTDRTRPDRAVRRA